MKRAIISLVFALLPIFAMAQQRTIAGTVLNEKDGSAVSGVNVIVRAVGGKSILGYGLTGEDGRYKVSYKTEADSVTVSVTGFNVRTQVETVASVATDLDIKVVFEKQKIREATVKADGIKRQGDTLKYYVSNFAEAGDRTIGDVIRKLPGMQVTSSGAVMYNGKEISKLYIEGMDMLGGRYGIATNNIQASDIAVVEVYEGHQPIKMLKDWVSSDKVAINLKLRAGAKGAWNGVVSLGAGYQPWLWDVEAAPMFFSRNFQTITTIKSNDTGEDVTRELISHFDAMDHLGSRTSVSQPSTPPVAENRHLDNITHAVSSNFIQRLGTDSDITADVRYIWWQDDKEGTSSTTYNLPDGTVIYVPESIDMTHRSDKLGANVQYRLNSKKVFIKEKFSFEGEWLSDGGSVSSSGDAVHQVLEEPSIDFMNYFQLDKRLGKSKISLHVTSRSGYNSQDATFDVSPTPYGQDLGASDEYPDARQTIDEDRLFSKNSISASWRNDEWTIYLGSSIEAESSGMESSLSVMSGEDVAPAADTMRNDYRWRKLYASLGPSVFYNFHRGPTLYLSLPVGYVTYSSDDNLSDIRISDGHWLFSPVFYLMAKITPDLRFNAQASLSETTGDLSDSYSGFIMSGYRSLGNSDVPLSRTCRQSYTADMSYGNAINALFFSMSGGWWRSKSNLTFGTEYDGALLRKTAFLADNVSSGLNAGGRVSKKFSCIATTFAVSGNWSRTWHDYYRQGELVAARYDYLTAGLNADTRIGKLALLSYSGTYGRSSSRLSGQDMSPIETLTQSLSVNFLISKKFTCKVGGEHYFNGYIKGDGRNTFFMDASLSYKAGRVEYVLDGRNLLDARSFSSAMYEDIMSYSYTTALRPISILLKVRFSLR